MATAPREVDARRACEVLSRLREAVEARARSQDEISDADVWQSAEVLVWESRRFVGSPSFYPVYRWGDRYSHSPLALLVLKRGLSPDSVVLSRADAPDFLYASGSRTIDTEISRLGGPVQSLRSIADPGEFAARMAEALRRDARDAEQRHAGFTNVILCGGRDSLNLTLLPWRNPTVLASAPPNYELVLEFVRRNGLDYPVVPLEDSQDDGELQDEVLEGCCRLNLEHIRWGNDLRRLADRHDGKVVFWKGQLGDAYQTPKWKVLAHPPSGMASRARRAWALLARALPRSARVALEGKLLEPAFHRVMWERCAMWQGAHMGLIRSLTGCLALSGYHGLAATRVLAEVDLPRAVVRDVRPQVGEILLGRPVRYPDRNPFPDVSVFRAGLCRSDRFLGLLKAAEFPISSVETHSSVAQAF